MVFMDAEVPEAVAASLIGETLTDAERAFIKSVSTDVLASLLEKARQNGYDSGYEAGQYAASSD